MSRSIHKTIKQIAQNNTKADLSDPENPDLGEYAKKREHKAETRLKRQRQKIKKVQNNKVGIRRWRAERG